MLNYDKAREYGIPDYMIDGLQRYIDHGIQPGSFLSAVLSNDLREAVGRADDTNIHCLPAYIRWLYNEAPAMCWGSPEAVDSWRGIPERQKIG